MKNNDDDLKKEFFIIISVGFNFSILGKNVNNKHIFYYPSITFENKSIVRKKVLNQPSTTMRYNISLLNLEDTINLVYETIDLNKNNLKSIIITNNNFLIDKIHIPQYNIINKYFKNSIYEYFKNKVYSSIY